MDFENDGCMRDVDGIDLDVGGERVLGGVEERKTTGKQRC